MKKIDFVIILIFIINFSRLLACDSTGYKDIFFPMSGVQFLGTHAIDNGVSSAGEFKDVIFLAPKIKTSKFYLGAGYTFVFFTDKSMSNAYPAFDIITDNFVGEFGAFFGIRFTNFLSMDLEASYIFVQNNRNVSIGLNPQVTFPGNDSAYSYAQPQQLTMYAFPLVLNLKLFPFSNVKSFSRHIYFGAGAGLIYIHENYYDVVYTIDRNQVSYPYTGLPVIPDLINSQWIPLFRISMGFNRSESGKAIGLGAELRCNFAALKNDSDPFITRTAQNFNSLDLTIKVYINP